MNTKYKINDAIEVNELDNELVIIIPQTEKMFYCNKLAKDIFYFIREGLDIQQIIESLFAKFDVDKETLKLDVGEILDKFVDFQIIIVLEEQSNAS